MGSPARVVAGGVGSDALDAAVRLVGELEARWSRFLPDSEISAVNRAEGSLVIVSDETQRLVTHAVEASQLTGGRFNPLMLHQLRRLGYRDPWQSGEPATGALEVDAATDLTIELIPTINGLRLPPGTQFDPGGMGKGLAVDFATELLVRAGASTVMVDIGGDLRVHGEPWYGERWRIGLEDPYRPDAEAAALVPTEGAVATSSRLRRAWTVEGVAVHHLLDPATGLPAETDLVTATACSSVAWWADVVAKVALMAGSARVAQVVADLRTPVVTVGADGVVTHLPVEHVSTRSPAHRGGHVSGQRTVGLAHDEATLSGAQGTEVGV